MGSDTPIILTAACTGNMLSRKDTPYIPYTTQELIDEGIHAIDAGASMLHIHARQDDGTPTFDPEKFIPQIEAFKRHEPDIVIQISVGSMAGRMDKCLEPLLAMKPDIASFNLKYTEEETLFMADMFKKYSIKPVIECFNPAMMDMVHEAIKVGLISTPLLIELLFELHDEDRSFTEQAKQLLDYIAKMPAKSTWSVTRGAKSYYKMQAMAAALGGNLRTGLEDHVFGPDGKTLLKSNADFIMHSKEIALTMGRTIATPKQARDILGV